ncbi:MAG: SLC13 family permease, partial [Gemmatimonadota bacterium]
FEMAFVFAVILAALALFATERYSVDQVALAVPIVLLAGGVIGPDEAVAGLSSPATVTVGAMLVLSLGLVKTGAVATISRWALRAPLGGPTTRLLALCLIVAAISPFLNNTAVVVVFLPVFLALARHLRESPSRFLIPLSFSAILGGTVTLIGTSTNLVVYGLARSRGFEELTMFSIAPLGLIYLGVGIAYLFTIGRGLLPHRQGPPALSHKYDVRSFITELRVGEGSPVAGQTLGDLRWGELYGVSVLGIQRGSTAIPAPGARRLVQAGDILFAQGDAQKLLTLARDQVLTTPSERVRREVSLEGGDARLVELMVAPGSPLVGRTLRGVRFQQRYDAVVLAIQHHGVVMHERLPDARLEVGDILLVHGPPQALSDLADDPDFVPLGEVESPPAPRPRALVAVAILAGVVAAAGTGLVSILPAALTGVVLMLFSGCVRLEEVYADLDWSVVFLLAGLIPLGLAMDASGAAAWVGQGVAGWLGPLGPVAAVGAFYLITSLLTEIMSNNASSVVLTPVALITAAELGLNPYALIVAVMFGASASFMTPIGYQTNTLVYGPGGYRFADFLRVGAPLNLLLLVTASLLIPLFWPS